ncbi:MAG: hypothetical protein ACKO8G_02045 [Actinomycetota bacterium]
MTATQQGLLLRAIGLVNLAFGVVAVLVPSLLVDLYEFEGTASVEAAVRFFGATTTALGLLAWRLAEIREAWRPAFGAAIVGQILLLAAAILAMTTGAAGPFMWQVVALAGIFLVLSLWARRPAA